MRATEIKNGVLSFPKQIIELCNLQDKEVVLQEMFDHLFYNFLSEKSTDTLIWIERVGELDLLKVLTHLSKSGWVTSIVENNYASMSLNKDKLLKWVTEEDLAKLVYDAKVSRHMLRYEKSTVTDLVSVSYAYNASADTLTKQYLKTGIVREGFMKAGNNAFSYDVKAMKQYKDMIVENLVKHQVASTKEIIHPEVIASCIDNYIAINDSYTLGNNISDSRGRAIHNACRKVFNPISCKEARACLVLPKHKQVRLNHLGEETIFAAIAELLGSKLLGSAYGTYENKVSLGYQAYVSRTMPELTLDTLHEHIWLSRLYDNLDRHFIHEEVWTVPVELDSTSSALAIIGVLLNDHTYMDLTNLIGEELKDAWSVDYVSRTHVKKAVTPAIYGSSATSNALWDKAKLTYNQQQLNDMNAELAIGRYAKAIQLKDFIINNVQTKPVMKVKLWNDTFTVHCNKFNWKATETKIYKVYDSTGKVKRITRQVAMQHDTEQFKRFFSTCMVHGIDSQIANSICENIDWVIPIHDAFLIHANDSQDLKEIFLSNIIEIYENREEILSDYFKSIGIDQTFESSSSEEVIYFSANNLK